MLARLQSAIGRDNLIEQMVLLPEPKNSFSNNVQQVQAVNLIVGYNGSPNSHTALDIAFWIAHQTRLATNNDVTVQAVYVVEENYTSQHPDILSFTRRVPTFECPVNDLSRSVTPVLTQPKLQGITPSLQAADTILWQARSLAQEWQGSFKSHLRFGDITTELTKVVESEAADILFLGCKSIEHPMIKILGADFPCAVVGIPSCIDE